MAASSSSAASIKHNEQSAPSKETDAETEFCPGFEDADAFVKHGLGCVVAATKASAALPQAGDEFDLYRSFPAFEEFCASQGDRLLHCMSQIMQKHGCKSHMKDRNKLTGLEDRFDLVVDSNDAILEKVGILLDEASGVNRTQQPVMPVGYQPPKIVVSSWNRGGGQATETFHLLHAKNIQRPQLKFKEKVDNSNTPAVSKIFIKPNALKPLPSYFTDKHIRKERPEDLDVPAALADFIHQQRTQEHVDDMFSHPYQYELDHLAMPESLNCKHEPQMYKSIAETSFKFINMLEDLVALNEKLAKVSEFAVDLEHHSYRSFLGITCLMQISTREEDFIIDTLQLRSEMYILNETFTDPAIVKVFHGADSDIEWLQKDFGLYVVNMFDTHQAARALNLGRNSLDHLMKFYCEVESDKRYQLADWRIRPLPDEMLKYARADTHYLLYVYDRVRADLYDMGNGQPTLIQQVWSKSRDLSLKKYVKPIFTEDSYMELYRKQKKSYNTQQLAAFRMLHAWRDKLARVEDESTGYVLPNHMMMKIAEELPKEPQGIIACCNPTPPLVRQQVNELHQFMKQAREIPLLKAEYSLERKKSVTPKRKLQSSLFGPHDTSRSSESDFLDLSSIETPTKPGVLFSEEEEEEECMDEDLKSLSGLIASAKISLFAENQEKVPASGHLTVAQQKAHSIMASFENPFRMYLPSKEIHISEKAKYDPSSKIYEIHNRWKLQSIEQQQKEVQAKRQAKEQAKKAQEERKKTKQSYQESLENVQSVRHQVMEAKQSGQKRERVASDVNEESVKTTTKVLQADTESTQKDKSSTPVPKKHKAKALQDPQDSTQNFKPFDYSQSNMKMFDGKSKESSQFDPNRLDPESKQKKRQKKQSSLGGRTMSYVPATSERGFRHNWPKR
ncbi:exosome component 10 [Triplophysa dalaica]|uniref:exosome component 10 n=1 Tax=Triplophysa dalaica TaxID=1582913 RepID=UPI0024DF63D0|nr:exosome component 10 [Triplophysa dalaica]